MLVQVESICAGLTRLVLNRPEKRNALSLDLLAALSEAIETLAKDATQRVVILTASGPVFSSGLDLTEAGNSQLIEPSAIAVERTLKLLENSELVTIGAARGAAYAGGAGILAACDMAIGADDLKIGFPEARRGILPALITDVLKKKVRRADLTELFLLGTPIDALRAQQIGILQRVVPLQDLEATSISMGMAILEGGPETIRHTKRLLHRAFHDELQSGSPHSAIQTHLAARNSPEAREGIAAFLEKRKPWWAPGGEH